MSLDRFRDFIWPPRITNRANAEILKRREKQGEQALWEVARDEFRDAFNQYADVQTITSAASEVSKSEAKRRESIEAKAATVVQAAGIIITVVSLGLAAIERVVTLELWAVVLLSALYVASVTYFLVAVYYAFRARRVIGLALPSPTQLLVRAKEGSDKTLPRKILAAKMADAKWNEDKLTIKINDVVAAENLLFRGLALFAISVVIYATRPLIALLLMKSKPLFASLLVALSANLGTYAAESDLNNVKAEITKRHDEAVKRLQDWIGQVSIAAEDRGYPEGAEYMAKLVRDAGFQQVAVINTDGKPGVFATLDAGAPKTVGLYFMYDVKQFDPSEWSSPPTEARIVDKPPLGKVMIGRGAVNQKGPEAAFLAALHAIRGAEKKMPVNLVLVAEGEEEIGSPHIPQLVRRPEVLAALKKCVGVFMPFAAQDLDGIVTVNLGSKGVIEAELVSSGEKWGRGPAKDIHSSLKAMVDSPAWHLVKALDTLVSDDGNVVMIDNYPTPLPLSPEEKTMIEKVSKRRSEALAKKQFSVQHWINDLPWEQANERLESQPTVNIEGLVGGYTGPGGKTILPHRAVAKIDMRLVPDMKAADALAALKAHLAKRGFGDIEVNMTGGYDPTATSKDSALIQAQLATYKKSGIDALLWPRNAGSYPGYVFTGEPLKLAAGHFGLGHGSGAHAPDEYYIIESENPKIQGFDGATMSFVEYLYELAK